MTVPVVDQALDAAVDDLARRFRAALEPPLTVGSPIDAAALRERLDEPLPETGLPVEAVLPALVEAGSPGLVGSTFGGFLRVGTRGVPPPGAGRPDPGGRRGPDLRPF